MDQINCDFDLLDLPDSVFQIHTEIFESENDLFSLHTSLDGIMSRNQNAKEDGVFRGRLAENLRGKGSTLHDFWTKFGEESKDKLQAQFLVTDGIKSNCAVEVKVFKTEHKGFRSAVRDPTTFIHPPPNCCTEVLKNHGPKAATKHFYEVLHSKSVVLESFHKPVNPQMKQKYLDRQHVLQSDDSNPETICALIERGMKSTSYAVKSSDEKFCQCLRCCKNRDGAAFKPEPRNVQSDGNGDNCSLYINGIEENVNEFMYITPNFGLSHLCHLNMLTDLDSYFAGISYPFTYVGGLHSFFPIHVEDMSLWSINFHHMGCPKLILIVAPRHVMQLSLILSHYGISFVHRSCLFKLSHKGTLVFPHLLLHHKINFKIIFQQPGDFIFFAPNAAHTGGNMGPNLNEACNIATEGWLPYGSVAAHNYCNCMDDGVHIDVTSMIKSHNKDLLSLHVNNSMEKLNDEFFQSSIIVGNRAVQLYSTEVVAGTVAAPLPSQLSSSAQGTKPTAPGKCKKLTAPTDFKKCPVEGCFKKYKTPSRVILERHIEKEHSLQAGKAEVKAALLLMFPERKTSGVTTPCPECGKLISVFSNKHRGSDACKRQQGNSQPV